MSPLTLFILRLLCVDVLLLLAHSLCTRVLVEDVVGPCDYILRTLSLAWLLHRHVEDRVHRRSDELKALIAAHHRALRVQLNDIEAVLRS